MFKFSKSLQNFAALVGATAAFLALTQEAQTMPMPGVEIRPSVPGLQIQPSVPGVEIRPSVPGVQIRPQGEVRPMSPSDQPAMKPMMARGNIVEVAAANGSFKTLTAALKAAGLDKTLATGGPYTVFAPTDEAFAALPNGTVEQLLKPENRNTLVKILTYHVIRGENISTNLKSGPAMTLEGAPVRLKVSPVGVLVNTSKVVQADVRASNGVIHVIDKVMLPPRSPARPPSRPQR